MRIKMIARTETPTFLPFNYQYQLQAAIYKLISQSSATYAEHLHDTGFVDEDKNLKLFTFSKLMLANKTFDKKGFRQVESFVLYFSTPIEKNLEHLVLGIFSNQILRLQFQQKPIDFAIENVETLPEPKFADKMKASCLSPIVVSGKSEKYSGKHYLNYTKPEERELFISQIKKNLLRKYKIIHQKELAEPIQFDFQFDLEYLIKKKGKISKNIRFKNTNIIGMEAPFTITAPSELIKIGYECGFGIENSAGFGMVELITKKEK